jgi:hypothetical protein
MGGAFFAFKGISAALAAVAAANAITADVMIFFIAERPKISLSEPAYEHFATSSKPVWQLMRSRSDRASHFLMQMMLIYANRVAIAYPFQAFVISFPNCCIWDTVGCRPDHWSLFEACWRG